MDEADKTFKWRCPVCGREFEEGNWGILEAKRQVHIRTCKQKEAQRDKYGVEKHQPG